MKHYKFIFIFSFFLLILGSIIFFPIFTSKNIIFIYAIHPFNICEKYPIFWKFIKILFIILYIITSIIISNFMFNTLFSKKKTTSNSEKLNILENELNLLIGINESGNYVYLNERSLYQNILITGTIGTGKTSSAMYPFTRQLIEFNFFNPHLKIGMLILDVKGNYHLEVYNYAKKFNRLNDLIVIELNGKYTYNPLNKLCIS